MVHAGQRTALHHGAAAIPAAKGGPVQVLVDDGEVFERSTVGAPAMIEFVCGQGEAPLHVRCSGPFDAGVDAVAAVILQTAAGVHRSAIPWPDGIRSEGTLEYQVRVPGVAVLEEWRTVDRLFLSRSQRPDDAWFRRVVPEGGAFRYRFLVGGRARVLATGN